MHTFLPKAGGYRNLRAFQLAEAICDLNAIFVKRFIPSKSRTCDQMEQAARSGKQNIAEGSAASATSKETEIKLTNVAKASLEELLLDYQDYLRQHNLEIWHKDNPRTIKIRDYLRSENFMKAPVEYAERYNASEFCNLMITLINQTTYLLRKLIEKQQMQFLQHGGIKELMFRARIEYRSRQSTQSLNVPNESASR
ncbi:MAG: four helix bundle suffix domain-containing protein [Candidatus Amulumruptor caecigallinarius]|nr:four helix bundle suffix domain-containing protein [Candidatus Amulumruptor caecigallinarius]MCM1397556.1 four helix bundle suffix domain-containing protein [Candidatus Amulumruptor caecigallinarius]MCM1454458.1 four helix bundle suffix domain-containing protein [bacterium]